MEIKRFSNQCSRTIKAYPSNIAPEFLLIPQMNQLKLLKCQEAYSIILFLKGFPCGMHVRRRNSYFAIWRFRRRLMKQALHDLVIITPRLIAALMRLNLLILNMIIPEIRRHRINHYCRLKSSNRTQCL